MFAARKAEGFEIAARDGAIGKVDRGYGIVATDGSIGHVEDFLVNSVSWRTTLEAPNCRGIMQYLDVRGGGIPGANGASRRSATILQAAVSRKVEAISDHFFFTRSEAAGIQARRLHGWQSQWKPKTQLISGGRCCFRQSDLKRSRSSSQMTLSVKPFGLVPNGGATARRSVRVRGDHFGAYPKRTAPAP